jgi:hypothetical protein
MCGNSKYEISVPAQCFTATGQNPWNIIFCDEIF